MARDRVLYAHASRILHTESNPGNARALVQRHGEGDAACDVWINPPAIPLTTAEMDRVYELPYTRRPHPSYGAGVGNGAFSSMVKLPKLTLEPSTLP